jgi:ferredoxin/flavodoxin
MKSEQAVIAVFSGTGNTHTVASALANELRSAGLGVRLAPAERPEELSLPAGSALGIAVPVACFSTYPTAWRFIDSLPPGEGREVFFLATMGGCGGGMEGPIRRVLEAKGYSPAGALLVCMPGNYANKKIDRDANSAKERAAMAEVRAFAKRLLEGTAVWPRGIPLLSEFFARLAHGRKPWNMFYKIFPLTVDAEKCGGCGMCAELCPEKNISMNGGKASIGKNCESCQRCIAFCPANAIFVPGKPAERYQGAPLEFLLLLLRGKKT